MKTLSAPACVIALAASGALLVSCSAVSVKSALNVAYSRGCQLTLATNRQEVDACRVRTQVRGRSCEKIVLILSFHI